MTNQQQIHLATKAAWLSYVGGYTQSQVAKKLNVSSAKAHRLIAFAHKQNIVKIFIEGEIVECVELEEQIVNHYKLSSCTVVPDLENESNDFKSIGVSGAAFLHNLLKAESNKVIGIGKGRSLSSVIDHLPPVQTRDLKFVSVSGGLTRKLSTNPFDVIHKIAEPTNAEAYFLPVPYMAKDSEEKKLLLNQSSVQQMLDFARTASIQIVGLGSIEENAHVHKTGLIEEDIWNTMVNQGAVGDFMGEFLDENGKPIQHQSNQLALGLTAEDIRGQKVVVIAGGKEKARAINAALKTKVITDLIIGETSAKKMVEKL